MPFFTNHTSRLTLAVACCIPPHTCCLFMPLAPPDPCPLIYAALGMNEQELAANKQVTEYVVHDLNLEPALPFPDDTFDVITNAVSVDYLNKPLEVFQEIHRCRISSQVLNKIVMTPGFIQHGFWLCEAV